jgi:hypothetical protein
VPGKPVIKESEERKMKYTNDWAAVSVMHSKKDIWTYTTFSNGLKLQQTMTAEKAAAVLAGLRSTPWKEKYLVKDNWESWKFSP